MTVLEVLRKAWERIEDPADWCRLALARDSKGCEVEPDSPAACQWCASFGHDEVKRLYRKAIKAAEAAECVAHKQS